MSLYYLFDLTHPKIESRLFSTNNSYISSGCTPTPILFCSTSWVENVKVAERALELWPDVKKFLKYLDKVKLAITTLSFRNLKSFTQDNLLEVKLSIFISIAKILEEPILKKYQSPATLIPFLGPDVFTAMKLLMER